MIKRLFDQISDTFSVGLAADTNAADREDTLRLATAVLMVDVARADHLFDENEFERVLQLIEFHFTLTPEQSAELINEAGSKADDMVSVYEFTRVLHKNLDDAEKARIISLLWQVAYADGRLDKYEDSLVLKISDLLYVSRGRVMRLKHDAQLASSR